MRPPKTGLALLLLLGMAVGAGPVAARDLTVEDTVTLRRALSFANHGPLVFSPDRSRYALLLAHADLSRNGFVVDVLIGRTSDLDAARPHFAATLFTTAMQDFGAGVAPPIHPSSNQLEWTAGGKLLMLWNQGDAPSQLLQIDPDTNRSDTLTALPRGVRRFQQISGGRILITSPAAVPSYDASRAEVIDRDDLLAILYLNRVGGNRYGTDLYLFSPTDRTTRRLATLPSSPELDFIVSPSGRLALFALNRLDEIPAAWSNYRNPGFRDVLVRKRGDPGGNSIRNLVLIDLATGAIDNLFDLPFVYPERLSAVWLSEDRLAIAPTFLPPTNPSVRGDRGDAAAIFDLGSHTVSELPLTGDARGRVVRAAGNGLVVAVDGAPHLFVRQAARWVDRGPHGQAEAVPPSPPVTVELREDLSHPPVLVATAAGSNMSSELLVVEPRYRDIRLGNVEMLSWADPDGRQWRGRLYYPVGFEAGRRYPLVVQTHGFADAATFSLLGNADFYGGVYAAQTLAARNIMVLQVQDWREAALAPQDEARVHTAGFIAGIEHLVERGLVDRARVGISGFSRAGWYVEHALAFSDFPFAAAIASDNVGYGYVEATLLGRGAAYGAQNGGSPSGAGLAAWLESAPPFSAGRFRTPLRLEILSGGMVYASMHWELYSQLRAAGLPVELWIAPDAAHGSHPLQNPMQRIVEQQGVVDWFSFWLLDRCPALAETCARWATLRQQRDAASRVARPPRLRWSATPVSRQ